MSQRNSSKRKKGGEPEPSKPESILPAIEVQIAFNGTTPMFGDEDRHYILSGRVPEKYQRNFEALVEAYSGPFPGASPLIEVYDPGDSRMTDIGFGTGVLKPAQLAEASDEEKNDFKNLFLDIEWGVNPTPYILREIPRAGDESKGLASLSPGQRLDVVLRFLVVNELVGA